MKLLGRDVVSIENDDGARAIWVVRPQRVDHEGVVVSIERWLDHDDVLTAKPVLEDGVVPHRV